MNIAGSKRSSLELIQFGQAALEKYSLAYEPLGFVSGELSRVEVFKTIRNSASIGNPFKISNLVLKVREERLEDGLKAISYFQAGEFAKSDDGRFIGGPLSDWFKFLKDAPPSELRASVCLAMVAGYPGLGVWYDSTPEKIPPSKLVELNSLFEPVLNSDEVPEELHRYFIVVENIHLERPTFQFLENLFTVVELRFHVWDREEFISYFPREKNLSWDHSIAVAPAVFENGLSVDVDDIDWKSIKAVNKDGEKECKLWCRCAESRASFLPIGSSFVFSGSMNNFNNASRFLKNGVGRSRQDVWLGRLLEDALYDWVNLVLDNANVEKR